ncbi:hypothetical protein LOZ53_005739 [Ophidiomyces ophidiicola]|uniref:Uncharacterized protein n=1 Tax=Ophidiomyces ophidiicola TaxID=1387563 RepID=A0ACB8UMA1_9EURO|nr:hypothetical protein LOZ55_004784 [Ophidiomyces ophidiicola]KAI1983736.1 hypothetical protein LOZ53_005739 [Ophidiomyces ophidiicola]KAI2007656.1 hypothetical protein LOZ49_004566 [Ophidiomyces ophidiicola]KAI2014217.1 hypothetical protein LOZ46_005599 [Ophidiomyces ophidiicola]KAI2106498.1 hypothetical protein LOZ42_006586 [Ophidiomyces ophidiicola]
MEDSLLLVQSAPPGCEAAAPLVLIHDGGGTAVSYFYLESLDRTVYAIQNPRFYSREPWLGGLPEMGRVYACLIRRVVASGPLILGGWSLGGMLALEVANVLTRSSDIQVLGIAMIDSVHPLKVSAPSANVVPYQVEYSDSSRAETRELVAHCMNMAVAMASSWVLPVWKGCPDQQLLQDRKELEATLSSRMPAEYSQVCDVTEMDVPWRDLPPPLPPTVLLRCNDYVPVHPAADNANPIARVDVVREQEKLGWDDYGYDFISVVLDIPGHHYNIFHKDHVSSRMPSFLPFELHYLLTSIIIRLARRRYVASQTGV